MNMRFTDVIPIKYISREVTFVEEVVSENNFRLNSRMSGDCISPSRLSKSRGPFYKHGLTLTPPWISNYIHYKLWDEMTYPFLNFNGATVEV